MHQDIGSNGRKNTHLQDIFLKEMQNILNIKGYLVERGGYFLLQSQPK